MATIACSLDNGEKKMRKEQIRKEKRRKKNRGKERRGKINRDIRIRYRTFGKAVSIWSITFGQAVLFHSVLLHLNFYFLINLLICTHLLSLVSFAHPSLLPLLLVSSPNSLEKEHTQIFSQTANSLRWFSLCLSLQYPSYFPSTHLTPNLTYLPAGVFAWKSPEHCTEMQLGRG